MARQLIIELVGKADKFTKSLDDAEKGTKSFGDKVGDAGKKMTAFATVPIVGFLGAATKAAAEDEAAQASLAHTLANTAGNSKALVTQVEGYITAAQKASTFTDDDLRPAFENLVRSTNNAEDANRLLSISMDVAAAKNIDLTTASMAVAKAHEGNFAAVNKLVPGLIDMKDKTLTADQAMGALAQTFGGSAAAATETAAGKAKIMTRDMGELTEKIGSQLLPVVSKFADFMTQTLLPALDSVSGDHGALILLGAAAAGPVVSGITAARNAVIGLNGALTFLAEHPVILFLISLALALKDIRDRFKEAHDEGSNFANLLKGIPGSGLSFIVGGAQKILGHANGGVIGGAIGQPQLAMVHGGERVIPFRGGQNGGSDGGGGVTVVVQGNVLDGRQLGDMVHNALLGKQRRSGSLGFAT